MPSKRLKCCPIPILTESDLARFWSKVDKSGDCWEWTAGTTGGGYGQLKLNGYMYKVHRISYTIANEDPGELNVNHTCDNPPCVNPDHLWAGTQQEGMADMVIKRRQTKGETNGRHVLTEKQVREILTSNETCTSLGKKYGVSRQNISAIKRGELWKHIRN